MRSGSLAALESILRSHLAAADHPSILAYFIFGNIFGTIHIPEITKSIMLALKRDYSCAGISTFAMISAKVAGMEMRDYMRQRLFDKIRIKEASRDVIGGGGYIGPHITGHIGMHISALELARFGYPIAAAEVVHGNNDEV
jgi:hypothetical protein